MNLLGYNLFASQTNKEVHFMKSSRSSSRSSVRCKAHTIPDLKLEEQDHTLTSFAGLVVFQAFFSQINLKADLRQCFQHLKGGMIFGHATIFLQWVTHILLGYRELRDIPAR